jgi:hypothetical protein
MLSGNMEVNNEGNSKKKKKSDCLKGVKITSVMYSL